MWPHARPDPNRKQLLRKGGFGGDVGSTGLWGACGGISRWTIGSQGPPDPHPMTSHAPTHLRESDPGLCAVRRTAIFAPSLAPLALHDIAGTIIANSNHYTT